VDLLQIVLLLHRHAGLQAEVAQSDDRVHRGADLMAHICEEFILDLAGCFCLALGFIGLLQFLDFMFKFFIDCHQHIVPLCHAFFQRQDTASDQQRKRRNDQQHECADRCAPLLSAL